MANHELIFYTLLSGIPSDTALYLARTLVQLPTNKVFTPQISQTPVPVTNIVFLGDSVSTQLCQYFICDLLRAGASYSSRHTLAVRSFDHTVSELIITSNTGDALLRVHNQQFNLPCLRSIDTRTLCDSDKYAEQSSYIYTKELLLNHTAPVATKGTRTYIIFNYGLHLKLKSRVWAIPGMMKAFVEVARATKGKVTFLYRETSSQTFSSSEGK